MADEFLRSKLYEYGANSNLVLEAERDGRRRGEAGKGEVETLRGKLGGFRMGDRIVGGTGTENDFNQSLKRKRRADDISDVAEGKGLHKKHSKFVEKPQHDSSSYTPKSAETRAAFEELLVEIRLAVGDLPHNDLINAATEVLAILKKTASESQKATEVRALIAQPTFSINKISVISTKITDMVEESMAPSAHVAEEEMAVVFEEDDDNDLGMLDDEDEEDDGDDDLDVALDVGAHAIVKGQAPGDEPTADKSTGALDVHDIDAYWLQRQLSKYYSDANISARLAEEALGILAIGDERLCENKLVVLLDFDKFDLIKQLLRNRSKLFYCIRLKQAQSDEERRLIEAQMDEDVEGGGPAILTLLRAKKAAGSRHEEARGVSAVKKEAAPPGGDVLESVTFPHDAARAHGEKLSVHVDKAIKLDDYVFSDGGHLMTNVQCTLPEQTWRAQKKGYEEVHVPALKPSAPPGEKLVMVSELQEWMHPVFDGMKSFNRVQSKLMTSALHGESNMLLCAPTGSGKTNVALLCMLGMIAKYRNEDGSINVKDFKIVYVAPMKALVQECVLTFGKRLAPLSINVRELSGDQSLSKQEIIDTQVIVTTPEKWDVVTRKVAERSYAQCVRLVIIDEVHLLHDERGPVLEALVARITRSAEANLSPVRLVGLSATLPNYKDVAAFLRVKEEGLHFFDNSYRPVPLQQQFIGVMEKKALKRMQLMNEICYEKALLHGTKNQVLIFTHSRADTVKTAKALRDLATTNDTLSRFLQEGSASHEILKSESANAKNPDLKELLAYGFAVHHAGLSRSDRTLVEDLFADKHIKVLVSTATLAWGVNLPCRTVIIKGTQMYSPSLGKWTELSPLDILQMMGRAGRFGLDSEGEGIILTDHSELQYYLSLMNQQLPIESHMVSKLQDLLNAEVVLGTVSSLSEAVEWLGYSYFFVRMLRRPALYGCSDEDVLADPTCVRARGNFVHAAISMLEKNGLVKYDRRTGNVVSTYLGRIASYYYLTAESAKLYDETLRASMSEIELFRLFSMSAEFKQIHVREEEKIELRSLLQRVPVPIKESVDEPSAKVNTLLQAYISRLKLEGFALSADMLYIQQSACRILRALFEISVKKEWSLLSLRLLEICIMAERRMWKSQSALRQFTAIPEIIVRKLEKIHSISWDKYCELSPQDLGELVKLPKMGKTLFKFVHMVPKMKISANVYPLSRSMLRFEVSAHMDFDMNDQVHGRQLLFWVLVEDADRERVLYSEPFLLRSRSSGQFLDFNVPLFDPKPPHYFITVAADRWLHSTITTPVSFKRLSLPPKFAPPSELLDLQALPVSTLKNSMVAHFFDPIKFLNPIQTQAFMTFYESDQNALLCAPHGSGKTLCAELAVWRALTRTDTGKVVCVQCNQDQADILNQRWSEKFAAQGIAVAILEGDQTKDLEAIKHSRVIIASPSVWEALSRKWRQRKVFRTIELFVFDDIHTIGGDNGAVMEIVLCRTRFMISQLQNSARIVGLSHCIANARDIGDVLGVGSSAVFNFAPNTRPTPLEVRIHPLDEIDFLSRLQAMSKPIFRLLSSVDASSRMLVFAPTRRHAQMLAVDLISLMSVSSQNAAFRVDAKCLELVEDQSILQTLGHGVGFLHESLSQDEVSMMQTMFDANMFKVLIVPFSMTFKISSSAAHVVLMDTVSYDGSTNRFHDLRTSDIWQMVGRAGDGSQGGRCVVFCHSSRKERLRTLVHDLVPLESQLDHNLHDFLNAEVVAQTISSKADAVDFLTWTFYYRRLAQNPNYYNLSAAGHQQLSDHLSELVETVISDLEECKCLSVENDMDLSPLNLGMISAFYGVSYTTVELFASSISSKSKFKAVSEILSAAKEVCFPLRLGEDILLAALSKLHAHDFDWASEGASEIMRKKAILLLNSHFSRLSVSVELRADQLKLLKQSVLLVQAMVDVISSQGWLKPALAAMEVSQCVVQGVRVTDHPLLQVPHFSQALVNELKALEPPVETVYDLLDMDNDQREKYLQFSKPQLSEIALFCNAYPMVQISYETSFEQEVDVGGSISVTVTCSRDIPDTDSFDSTVVSSRYPHGKKEAWWLVVGDATNNVLFSIKRFVAAADFKAVLEFNAPAVAGDYKLSLYLICDSYVGCDQEYELPLTVV